MKTVFVTFNKQNEQVVLREVKDCPLRFEKDDHIEIESTHDSTNRGYVVTNVVYFISAFGGVTAEVYLRDTGL